MTINNSKQEMTSEYRQLQYELQCQEALLVLMQKLKANQRIISQTNNVKQRTTTPVNATKLNSITPTKQPSSVNLFDTINKQKHFILFRLQPIDQHQLNHLIPINIQLIDQIIIHNLNHQNLLYHYLKLLVRQIIQHYQQQLLVYHRQYQVQQRKLRQQ
jgi:hypothetical protein